jgi:hypothetical protein
VIPVVRLRPCPPAQGGDPVTAQALGDVSVPAEDTREGLEPVAAAVLRGDDLAAVIVPWTGDLGRASCLAGADVRTAQRHLRARVPAVHAEDKPATESPLSVDATDPIPLAGAAALAEPWNARLTTSAEAWDCGNRLIGAASDGGRRRP